MVCERCGGRLEPGDGSCADCSPPDRALAGGCVHCREEEPVTCEGYCVHCGREVISLRAQFTESSASTPENCRPGLQVAAEDARSCPDRGMASELSYGERLSVAWLFIWRGAIVAAPIGFVTGFLVRTASRGGAGLVALSFLPAFVAGLFVVAPWSAGAMVKKRFRSFNLAVLREQQDSDRGTRASEPASTDTLPFESVVIPNNTLTS